jgi:hypothetical protein
MGRIGGRAAARDLDRMTLKRKGGRSMAGVNGGRACAPECRGKDSAGDIKKTRLFDTPLQSG